jgi:hypothetical protein
MRAQREMPSQRPRPRPSSRNRALRTTPPTPRNSLFIEQPEGMVKRNGAGSRKRESPGSVRHRSCGPRDTHNLPWLLWWPARPRPSPLGGKISNIPDRGSARSEQKVAVFPQPRAPQFFLKKALDTSGTPALQGVPVSNLDRKPFIFNMFQQIKGNRRRADFGDNSPRLKEQWAFRLSTRVDKPVDNLRVALDAGFSILIRN